MRADIEGAARRVHHRDRTLDDALIDLEPLLQPGELVDEVAGAQTGDGTGALVLTDRRVLLVAHRRDGERHDDVPLPEVDAVEVEPKRIYANVKLTGRHPLRASYVDKRDAEYFASAMQNRGIRREGGPPAADLAPRERRDRAAGEPRFLARVPYATSVTMPAMCTGCGAPAGAASHEVSRSYRGGTLHHGHPGYDKRTFTLSLPACTECTSARHETNTLPGLPSLGIMGLAGAVFGIVFVLSGQNFLLAMGAAVVTLVAGIAVLARVVEGRAEPAVRSRAKQLDASAAITEVVVDDHLSVEFARRDVAEAFARLNGGEVEVIRR